MVSMRVSLPADVLVRRLKTESVLLSLRSEQYFGLDAVGTRMWEVLTTSESVEAACTLLLGEYDVEAAVLRQDALNLIAELVRHGLLETSDE
ncbi:PqqD family protein [Gloeobacter kilaueensis]|uniref:PqqD family protein n=1 Tax=Gloeobacter kilaueensis (strain ATCC BAA-2537 / CCAP 1431/1 / ULC 316 / JS1) TaxID=1183438 RepID=U5QLE2_GLOK1|nr:PqqD family protein [Gloeobacter kilaueensis]AGY58409.1 hypothetical protein GKIL_2163 [Gloeobacter kilaueensis JS1]